MPGVVPLEDAQNYYVDRLKQHAQDGWQALTSTAQQAPQQLAAAAPAALQIDPNEIIQRLQQHAQQTWQDAQDQAQQAQPTQQQPLPTIDASDVTNRLQQHAQDTWKSLDAGVQQIGQGVQSFNQPPPQTPTPTTQDASTSAQATSAVIQPNQPTQPQADQGGPAPDRSMSYQDYARAAARKAGIDPNVFMAQIQQESGFNPAARSPAGAIGIAQFMPATAAGVHLDPTDPYASLDAAAAEDAKRLQQYEGDWGKTLASYNAGTGAVAQYGGIPPYKETQSYVQTIMGNAQKAADAAGTAISGAVQAGKQAVSGAVQGAQQAVTQATGAVTNKLSDLIQLPEYNPELTAAEAYAACGPAAAVRFAQLFGRNPTLREATDMASKVGWTVGGGMAGLGSESKLFDEMGIPHRTVGADWNALAKEASSGNPVVISTPGHYFTADSYDSSTGAFHVGRSGLDLKGGSEWMTPAQMQARMGALQGGLASDNPGVPGPSPLSQPSRPAQTTAASSGTTPRAFMGGLQDAAGNLASDASHAIGQGMQGVGQAVGGTLQQVDNAVQSAATQATAPAKLEPGQEPATTTLSAAATPAVQAAQDVVRKVPGPFGVSTVGDIADTAGNIAGKVQTPDENAPGGVVGRAVGTGLSALGSAAQEATAALDKINVASNLARDATGSDQYNNLYAQAGGPALEDEYRTLLQRRMNGDDSVSPRMTEIVNQLQSINDGIRGGTSRQDQGELNQRLSEQNPLTGSAVGLANVGAAGLATVLAAGDAPLALRAVAEVLQPGTNPLEIARALTAVDGARGTAPAVANAVDQAWQSFGGRLTDTAAERAQQIASMDDSERNQLVQAITNAAPVQQVSGAASKVVSALSDIMKPDIAAPQLEQAIKTVNETTASVPDIIDQVRKMPGTAELAPVRQQVPQSSTDLLQAMLDAARAKGVDPDKLTALEKQITDMDPTAATRRALTPPPAAGVSGAAEVPGVGGAVGDFLRGESGAVPLTRATLRGGATLGGAVAGGVAGNESTPEGAGPIERGVRIAAGAGIGALAGSAPFFRGTVDQHILQSLHASGVVPGTARAAPPWRGIVPEVTEGTKQLLLTNPVGRISDIIGNTIELGRQPISLALGGRGDDALAGITSVAPALREAAGNALEAIKGHQLANLSEGAANIPLRSSVYRVLSATDAFTRTLAEYQGMSSEANRLLRDAGMSPGDPGAAAFLAGHAADLYRAGARDGARSVFAQTGATVGGATGAGRRVQNFFDMISRHKEGMLASPNRLYQAGGALLDFNLPFTGVPVRLLRVVADRTPPGTQIGGAWKVADALAHGRPAEAQRHMGEMVLETTIQALIAKNIADGNIRGPDDKEHPNGINVPGMGWIDTRELGGYALPMQVMAAFAEGWDKGGQNVPEGTPGATDLEKYTNYYGPRFNAALNSSMVPFSRAIPGTQLLQLLSLMTQGNFTGAAAKEGQTVVNRLTSVGALRFIENATDPVARDVAKSGVKSLWESSWAGIPGLANTLPVKIDPTTGEPAMKARSGLGTLVGAQQDVVSPITVEADRLNKAGFKDVVAPSAYPDSITITGSKVSLSPDEQRAVTQITGSRLDQLAVRLDSAEYQNAPDERKAQMLKATIATADKIRESAVTRVLGTAEVRSRVLAGRQVGGRLRNQAEPPPPFNPLGFLSPQEQPAAVGAR